MKYSEPLRQAVGHLVNNYMLGHLHPAMVAQWILESDRGFSHLAKSHNNFGGIKFRPELAEVARPRAIKVPSEPGPVDFADFETPRHFVRGVFKFLDRAPYAGWRDCKSPEEYIQLVGKVWATDPDYRAKLLLLLSEARDFVSQFAIRKDGTVSETLLNPQWFELYKNQAGGVWLVGYYGSDALFRCPLRTTAQFHEIYVLFGTHNVEVAPRDKLMPIAEQMTLDELKDEYNSGGEPKPGTGESAEKPAVLWRNTPNQSSRNGVPIKKIVLHYTTSSNPQGTISWFANPASRVSAHYMVGRDGTIWQFVADDRKAWHAAGHNADSIGIENVAAAGQKLTNEQEQALVKLCRFLMAEYKIPASQVTAHKYLPYATSCPGSLWPTEADLKAWVEKHLA